VESVLINKVDLASKFDRKSINEAGELHERSRLLPAYEEVDVARPSSLPSPY